jgi:septal ring factor EnvC (AmiA/AmiB activator)
MLTPMDNNIFSILATAITVLGGSAAWRYYEKRAMHREKDEDFIRHDCKDRISKLEALLEASSREKDELRSMVLTLTKEVAALTVKVEFLTSENQKLEKSLLHD